ncbi:S-adenosylmethionine tRNA ribosyltransferase [Alkalihalobacillus trypoxylicola]|uniref:S-adenosylmethionine tRNA ribosyltransferase n=2 Tax=Alkalihalobacillus trypoxylicola TaxID=519424 RepID=A0A161PWW6_9BACI|nr:S-adenosylmethionine tRNA ribosyltransferase [Alkalihalobacillus trypoxylicola]
MDMFKIPPHLNATVPAEYRLTHRSQVSLMLLNKETGQLSDHLLTELPQLLSKNDLLIFNSSRTIPASILSVDQNVEIRLARKIDERKWEAILLDSEERVLSVERLDLPEDVNIAVVGSGSEFPLVTIEFQNIHEPLLSYLYRFGEPIRYEYIDQKWPLDAYQTIFASSPGSIEMPSAGRAFSWKLMHSLQKAKIKMGFLELHTGISYYGNHIWPNPINHPEAYYIPHKTIQLMNQLKANNGRLIAVGTTVVRAIESFALQKTSFMSECRDTHLYIHSGTTLQMADAIITGLHEPEASHLDMLKAFTKSEYLNKSYDHALKKGYLWHEFGDIQLIL